MILAVIENISDKYGGPANSLPNFLNSVRSELSMSATIYSVKIEAEENNFFIERFSLPGVNCEFSGPRKLMYSNSLRRKIEEDLKHDDVIFSNNLWNYTAYLCSRLSCKFKLPHIISIRGSLYPWSLKQGYFRKKVAWYLFQKNALQKAKVIHVTCQDELNVVRSLGITSPIALIPHGINFEDYQNLPEKDVALKSLKLVGDKKYLLFMSRLHKKKGLDLLLSVWPRIVSQFKDWCLLIVGPDYSDYVKKLNEVVIQHQIDDHIKYLGMLTGFEKLSVLSVSSFFVLPSYSENFGVAVGEALASGLPTITTTGTPWAEVDEYDCGKFIELSESKLENAIIELFSCDDDEYAQMSQNAKLLIKQKYSWESQSKKFSKVIEFIDRGVVDEEVIKVI